MMKLCGEVVTDSENGYSCFSLQAPSHLSGKYASGRTGEREAVAKAVPVHTQQLPVDMNQAVVTTP